MVLSTSGATLRCLHSNINVHKMRNLQTKRRNGFNMPDICRGRGPIAGTYFAMCDMMHSIIVMIVRSDIVIVCRV